MAIGAANVNVSESSGGSWRNGKRVQNGNEYPHKTHHQVHETKLRNSRSDTNQREWNKSGVPIGGHQLYLRKDTNVSEGTFILRGEWSYAKEKRDATKYSGYNHWGWERRDEGNQPRYLGNNTHPNISYSNPNNFLQLSPGFSVTNCVIDDPHILSLKQLLKKNIDDQSKIVEELGNRVEKLETDVSLISKQIRMIEVHLGQIASLSNSHQIANSQVKRR